MRSPGSCVSFVVLLAVWSGQGPLALQASRDAPVYLLPLSALAAIVAQDAPVGRVLETRVNLAHAPQGALSGQDPESDLPPGERRALGMMRWIHTTQAQHLAQHGVYGDLPALFRTSLRLPGWSYELTPQERDRLPELVMDIVVDRSGKRYVAKIGVKERCGWTYVSDEMKGILKGRSVGCDTSTSDDDASTRERRTFEPPRYGFIPLRTQP